MADTKISVVVKPAAVGQQTIKYTLEQVDANSEVKDFKELVSAAANVPASQIRLIYKGQILKDERTLDSYGIGHEHVLHMVKSKPAGTQPSAGQPAAAPTANTTASPATATPATPATAPAAPGGAGLFGGLPGMMNPMEVMNNPELMQQMMNNPMVQSMMNNPELLRSMVNSNPMMQQIIERNPELASVFNDPALIRQSLQIASNPSLMREHMRHADRAMSNLEAMPEGFNALRRLFENVQEPLMNAAAEMTAPGANSTTNNAAAANNATNTSSTDPTPNAAPLPNPWAPAAPASGAQNRAAAAPAGLGLGSGLPGLAGLGGLGGFGGMGGLGAGGAGTGSALQAMSQMLQQPGARDFLRSVVSAPGYMEEMINRNPAMRQLLEAHPYMRERVMDPAYLEQMLNPEALQAMSSLQSMLAPFSGMNAAARDAGGPGNMDPAQLMNLLQSMGPLGGGAGGGLDTNFAAMAQAFGGAGGAPVANPEATYASQLESLQSMGFTDTQANIRALQATGGNVHAAVDRLLSGL